jgi:uroporphyrinogen decarboxylase
MYKMMDDLLDDVGIDAKHSFEDKILPVEEAYRRWGDKTAILGGVDMDLLTRGSEEQVRARVGEILDVCGTKGTGYGLGTGNTAANYIPRQNYLAMLDEGRRWNQAHFGRK